MSSMSRCCDTGRPIAVDSVSGRTVCSCQLQRGVPSYLSRVPSLPETVYGTGTGMYPQTNMLSAMYKMYGHDGQVDPLTMAAGGHHPVVPMSAHAIAAHPYGIGYPGFDINGAPRKNATRETTSPLKAWLYTHKKNPYPTKAEKIMLAIVTRMTLTQVSTWFANARRRLKKENRLNGKDDDALSDISGNDDRIDVDSSSDHLTFRDGDDVSSNTGNLSDISELSDSTDQNIKQDRLGRKCVQKLFSPDGRNELYLERLSSPELSEQESGNKSEQDKIHMASINIVKDFCVDKVKPVREERSDIHEVKQSENLSEGSSVSSEKVTVAAPQQKPKIWSIVQMIG